MHGEVVLSAAFLHFYSHYCPGHRSNRLVTGQTVWSPVKPSGHRSNRLVTGQTVWSPVKRPGHRSNDLVTGQTAWSPVNTPGHRSNLTAIFVLVDRLKQTRNTWFRRRKLNFPLEQASEKKEAILKLTDTEPTGLTVTVCETLNIGVYG
jgi:hypothetical protein